MLTERKLILVVPNEKSHLLEEIRFKAITQIKNESEIGGIWKLNKTPIILESNLSEDAQKKYDCVYITESMEESKFIDFCHSLGFECGWPVHSQKRYNMSSKECFFCKIANREGMGTAEFNANTQKYHDVVVYESDYFDVKVELGCITPGLLMISPKRHIVSIARCTDFELKEYKTVKKDIQFLLENSLGQMPTIFFEHGSSLDGKSSHKDSIVHAHTHVVPGVKVPMKYLNMVCMQPVSSITELADKKYLLFHEGAEGQMYAVSNPEVFIPRQYFRQVIAQILGLTNESSNWKKEEHEDNIMLTFELLLRYLQDNWEALPERIRKATSAFVTGYSVRMRQNS